MKQHGWLVKNPKGEVVVNHRVKGGALVSNTRANAIWNASAEYFQGTVQEWWERRVKDGYIVERIEL